jgi:subtilisin-like proprotein convertase family protein
MKNKILLGTLLLLVVSAHGALYTETFNSGSSVGTIPDGNPVGVTFGGMVSDTSGGIVSGLTVSLNFSGGYNGNLYAYLVAPNGTRVLLLNQPGTAPFYAPGSGMNVTLSDAGSSSIQNAPETAGQQLTGTYSAAGALVNFNGSAADGNWELFFADEVNGGGTSRLNSWSLDINCVPEPVNVALGIFGVVLTAGLARRFISRPADPVG